MTMVICGYTVFFQLYRICFFQNNPKALDLPCKMDLIFGTVWKRKTHFIAESHKTDL